MQAIKSAQALALSLIVYLATFVLKAFIVIRAHAQAFPLAAPIDLRQLAVALFLADLVLLIGMAVLGAAMQQPRQQRSR